MASNPAPTDSSLGPDARDDEADSKRRKLSDSTDAVGNQALVVPSGTPSQTTENDGKEGGIAEGVSLVILSDICCVAV
jgi:hypothetical protein